MPLDVMQIADTSCRRFEVAPIAVAAVALAQLIVVRLLFWSDGDRVLFLGTPFGTDCAFRMRFGIPCPGCGLTRSVALTLYGHIAPAFELNPLGPMAILGLVLLSIGLLAVSTGRL